MQERKDANRSRETNWTADEKEALRKCVKPYMGIIEDKNNDAATIARKNKAWLNIKKTMQAAGYDRAPVKFRAGWTRIKFSDKHSQSAEGRASEVNGSMKDYNISDNMTEAFSADDETTFADDITDHKQDELAERKKVAKRVRETNWTSREKAYLRQFINSHMDIIEEKSNDNVTIKKKREAWNQIKIKMLSKGYNRHPNKLRQQWVRMKLAARKAGRKVKPEMTELSSAESDDMCFDSMMGGTEEFIADPILVEERNDRNVIEQRQEQRYDQRQEQRCEQTQQQRCDQRYEQRHEHVQKTTLKQQPTSTNSDEIHMLQIELLHAQIQHQRTLEHNEKELHALKMQHARELHSRKMQLLQKQITDQQSTTDPQEDHTIEKAINGLWN